MQPLQRLLFLTALEAFSTILTQRAVYFHTVNVLGYSDMTNLLIALALGATYVFSTRISHVCSRKFGEKELLLASLAGLGLINVCVGFRSHGVVLVAGMILGTFLHGFKWPVIQSYFSVGRTPRQTSTALGHYNLTWSSAMPIAMVCSGPVINHLPGGIFWIAAVLNGAAFLLATGLIRRPTPLDPTHPERLDPSKLARFNRLLASNRWTMLNSYALMFLLGPLIPGVFIRLDVALVYATGLSAVVDFMRVAVFYLMRQTDRWHGRASLTILAIPSIPAGFVVTLFGPTLFWVLIGQLLLGAGSGICYYSALYYAMIVENASVKGGGGHEGFIGLGFTFGPVVGIAAVWLTGPVGGALPGMLVALAPLVGYSMFRGVRPLTRE